MTIRASSISSTFNRGRVGEGAGQGDVAALFILKNRTRDKPEWCNIQFVVDKESVKFLIAQTL